MTAAELVASATIEYIGTDWGPVPIYRVVWGVNALPRINASFDVHANDETDARIASLAPITAFLEAQE